MKKLKQLTEEHKKARQWAEDEQWVLNNRYRSDEEYLNSVKDILEHPIFNSMDYYIQHGHTTCKTHCIQVSYMTYCISKKHGWNYVEAARAGLLHDLFLYDWHTHRKETGNCFHGLTHPRTALQNAEKYFLLTDREKNLILRHMWPLTPIPPKYKEGYAILYADKFCSLAEVIANAKKWMGRKHDILGRISKKPGIN